MRSVVGLSKVWRVGRRSKKGGSMTFGPRAAVVLVLVAGTSLGALGSAGAASDPRQDYIVVLRPSVTASVVAPEQARTLGGMVKHVYRAALNGYTVRLSERMAKRLAADPRVAFVEEDGVVSAVATQTGATWGLDRIDQRALPLTARTPTTATGAGVTRLHHRHRHPHRRTAQFGGRATERLRRHRTAAGGRLQRPRHARRRHRRRLDLRRRQGRHARRGARAGLLGVGHDLAASSRASTG